jgi:hypothetical protein
MKHRDVTFIPFTCCNPRCVKVACPGNTASLRAHVTHFLGGGRIVSTHTYTQATTATSAAFSFLFSMWANVNTANTVLANNKQVAPVATPENAGLQILTALTMNSSAFLDVTPCSLDEVYRRSGIM